jgi:hypothetical protein
VVHGASVIILGFTVVELLFGIAQSLPMARGAHDSAAACSAAGSARWQDIDTRPGVGDVLGHQLGA